MVKTFTVYVITLVQITYYVPCISSYLQSDTAGTELNASTSPFRKANKAESQNVQCGSHRN